MMRVVPVASVQCLETGVWRLGDWTPLSRAAQYHSSIIPGHAWICVVVEWRWSWKWRWRGGKTVEVPGLPTSSHFELSPLPRRDTKDETRQDGRERCGASLPSRSVPSQCPLPGYIPLQPTWRAGHPHVAKLQTTSNYLHLVALLPSAWQ
jgi:hypothetical protein